MTGSTDKQRRRYPRFRLPAQFKLKARVRTIGKKHTHYFDVDNLSMGGAHLTAHKGVNLDTQAGDVLEILFFSGDLSLRCVARVAQGTFAEKSVPAENQLETFCVQLGIEIVGIDEKSRKLLGDFLLKLDQPHTASRSPVSN